MRVTADDFEAALRRKRPASGEPSRPPKRPRSRDLLRPAATTVNAPSAREPVERKPAVRVAPRPAATEIEEGEIPTTTEATVVVLDEEEGVPAAATRPEAGQVTIAEESPAAAEPARERTPPATEVGERTAEGAPGGAEAAPREPRAETRGPPRPLLTFQGSGATEGPGMVRPVRRPDHMDNAVEAHLLMSGLQTGEYKKAMEGMTHSELLDMAMVSIVKMGNAAIGIREALGHSSETLAKALAKSKRYREESAARGEKLSRLQAESAAREEGLTSRLKEAESRASAAEARAELALEKLKNALERASAAEGAADAGKAAAEEARAAKERAAVAEKTAAEVAAEKAEAVARAGEADERAREAEARAKEAECKAQQAAAGAEEAKERAREAEARAKEAEGRAQQAVADFKASNEFKQEIIEGGLEAYVQGFEKCKSRIATAFQIDVAEFEDIRPGGGDEEPAEEQKGGEPAPGDHDGEVAPGEP